MATRNPECGVNGDDVEPFSLWQRRTRITLQRFDKPRLLQVAKAYAENAVNNDLLICRAGQGRSYVDTYVVQDNNYWGYGAIIVSFAERWWLTDKPFHLEWRGVVAKRDRCESCERVFGSDELSRQ